MSTDLDAAWSALHDAKPPGWFVGRPTYIESRRVWEQYAFDPAEKAKIGVHAYATLSRQAGVSMSVISQSLGHSNYSTTSDIYSHLMAPEQVEAAARLDGLLGVRREVASG